jgi:hypothetical protein
MKTATAATLVVGLLVASVMLTAISVLGSLDQPSDDIRMVDQAPTRQWLLTKYSSRKRRASTWQVKEGDDLHFGATTSTE